MFIYVKYGDGEHFLANPNCPLRNFVHYMEEKLNIQNPDTVDLYDDQLNLKFLFRIKDLTENVENIFEHRGIYHACKIERNPPDNSFKSIIPLEDNPSEELIAALQNQCVTLDQPPKQKPEKRRGKGSSKSTAEDEPVGSKGSGRSRMDQGKKSGKS